MGRHRSEPRAEMGAHIGSASIVMIFAVLCLTIFAALAFETAGYEQRLAEKSAAAAKDYYIADSIAEERYYEIYQHLQSGASMDVLRTELEAINVGTETVQEGLRLFYTVPIDDVQSLQVVLLWQNDHVLRTEWWRVGSTMQWEYDDTLAVWDGTAAQTK